VSPTFDTTTRRSHLAGLVFSSIDNQKRNLNCRPKFEKCSRTYELSYSNKNQMSRINLRACASAPQRVPRAWRKLRKKPTFSTWIYRIEYAEKQNTDRLIEQPATHPGGFSSNTRCNEQQSTFSFVLACGRIRLMGTSSRPSPGMC